MFYSPLIYYFRREKRKLLLSLPTMDYGCNLRLYRPDARICLTSLRLFGQP